MCNPRRVRVRATRQLAESWEQEVRRQVVLRGRAVGQARVREPLGASVGGPTLATLTGVLARADGWDRDGDTFRYTLDGGYVVYHPATRELEIVAEAGAEVEASADASTVVRGQVTDTVETEGEGRYYDDNFGGVTETDARRAAERAAARAADARAAELLAAARRGAEETEAARVEAAAAARGEEALAAATAARVDELNRAAASRLVAVGIQGRNAFHQALAGAYREAILAYARSRRAEGVTWTESDGVLDIEFELRM